MTRTSWFRRPSVAWLAGWASLLAPVLVLWLVFVGSGLRGVDYGFHWDENEWQVQPVRNAIASGILLPRSYIYPTFAKWLVLAPTAFVALDKGLATSFDPERMKLAMLAAVDAPKYLLTARSVFIVASSLTIFWMYAAGLAFRLPRWAALVAAAAFGLSWEFAYHARYVATDCLLTQWVACVVFLLGRYLHTRRAGFLHAASIAAGLATGTKYPGLFVLLPVMLAGALTLPHRAPSALLLLAKRTTVIVALAFAAYLLTTPGTLLDPYAFIGDARWISKAYSTGLGGYTAKSGWDHARLALEYLALAYYSPSKLCAVAAFAATLVGAVLWARSERRVAAVLLVFPVVFLLTFCARFRIVTVRNYIFVMPFLALFLAKALAEASARLRSPRVRKLGAGALATVGVLHAAWLVRAGESIRHVDPKAYVRQALAYAAKHGDQRFRISAQVRRLAQEAKLKLPPNVTAAPKVDAVVFFGKDEGPGPWNWRSNDPFQALAVFGPLEMNFDWYTSWMGHDRVVVMTLAKARATKVPSAL